MQIAAPSRSSIDEYQSFEARVRAAAERINRRFGGPGYEPIVLRVQHHDPSEVYTYYRAADLCYVSSLHDGMNLVAKEFVAARDDERGVLILSQFTGAARELVEALIVNPYDIEQSAAALHLALTMTPGEQRDRMRSMRALRPGVQRVPLGGAHADRRRTWSAAAAVDLARRRARESGPEGAASVNRNGRVVMPSLPHPRWSGCWHR